MKQELLEQLPPLFPADFFAIASSVHYAKKPFSKLTPLPSISFLFAEESFAKIAMGWREEGLYVEAIIKSPFEEAFYPKYDQGDSLELFFDTRAMKSAGFATRFCHHFVILPQEVQGIQVQEVTHFRSEDTHPLAEGGLISVSCNFERFGYSMQLFFPSEVLHGYDPLQFQRLGFTYKINRFKGYPQHFSVSSQIYPIAQQPSLWATLTLER